MTEEQEKTYQRAKLLQVAFMLELGEFIKGWMFKGEGKGIDPLYWIIALSNGLKKQGGALELIATKMCDDPEFLEHVKELNKAEVDNLLDVAEKVFKKKGM